MILKVYFLSVITLYSVWQTSQHNWLKYSHAEQHINYCYAFCSGMDFYILNGTLKIIIMTTTTIALTEVLNDLIKINYDRIEGYRKAAEESKEHDIDLHAVFTKMANESRLHVSALNAHVQQLGGDPEHDSTTMGKIYRAWMDVKATFTGKDRHSIIAACEFGEDQAQKAYDEALSSNADIDTETRQLIMAQKETLKKSHDEIKAMRDAGK